MGTVTAMESEITIGVRLSHFEEWSLVCSRESYPQTLEALLPAFMRAGLGSHATNHISFSVNSPPQGSHSRSAAHHNASETCMCSLTPVAYFHALPTERAQLRTNGLACVQACKNMAVQPATAAGVHLCASPAACGPLLAAFRRLLFVGCFSSAAFRRLLFLAQTQFTVVACTTQLCRLGETNN